MHLSDGQIQRLIHGELDAASRDVATRHALECPACAQAIATAESEESAIFDLLDTVDHEMPVVDAARITTVPAGGRSSVWGRRAAGIVVVAALAGAAYAIPGSPLPGFVKRVAGLVTGAPVTPPAANDHAPPAHSVTSGIAVPVGDHFLVQFALTQETGTMTVWLTDNPLLTVRVLGGTAAFTTDAGRLDIANEGSSADYEIELPRGASRIEIRVASFSRLQKDGAIVLTDWPADAQGRHRVSLAPDSTSSRDP